MMDLKLSLRAKTPAILHYFAVRNLAAIEVSAALAIEFCIGYPVATLSQV